MNIASKFENIVKDFGKHNALAFLVDDRYKKISYNDLNNNRLKLAGRWENLGFKKGEKISIMLPNSPEWIISDLAAATLGLIVVPIHTTYNSEYIKKIITHSESKYLIIHRDFVDKHLELLSNLNLSRIVVVGDSQDLDNKIFKAWPLLEEEKGYYEGVIDINEDDIHTIIYTSGTTGDPKGVMLTHKNIVLDVESAKRRVLIDYKDRFFSFLPLSHAFERVAGYYAPIFSGSSIYFARSAKTIVDDIKKAKPTMLSSVPRIFEKIYGKIFDQIDTASNLKRKLFFKAVQLAVLKRKGRIKLLQNILFTILDAVVLNKIRKVLGGNLRVAISGGASLDLKIMRFFENIGIAIIEGYGMTETSPIIAVNSIGEARFGTVGKAIDCNEVIISNNKEILVRGQNVMKGYYKYEEKIIDEDGWFHTGDLGFIDKEGFITIIGRAKDVIVLSTGKNIFPEAIENTLNESRYISQSMVYGDRNKNLSALIVPNFEQLKNWCKRNNINFDLSDERIESFYREKINHRLRHHSNVEQVVSFKILSEEFSQQNGFLTPTLKLKRHKIINNIVK